MNRQQVLRELSRGGRNTDDAAAIEAYGKIPDEGVINLLSRLVREGHITQEKAQPVFDAFVAYYTPEEPAK